MNAFTGRLSKRHLSLMSRNSAFRGFKYPASSRHGSTNSTCSTTFSKSNSNSGHKGSSTSAEPLRYSHNQKNGSRNPSRANSVSKSVFAVMFPTWTEEAVQFLTLCLDPEPSGRPTCAAAMRLPYFSHDSFPSRYKKILD